MRKSHSKKVAFIAFSDIQIEDWKNYSVDHSRLYHNRTILSTIVKACEKYQCPALFGGDLFDNPKALSNKVLYESVKWLLNFTEKTPCFAIDGNHDQCEQNSLSHRSPNYVDTISKMNPHVQNISFHTLDYSDYLITGISYLTGNADFLKAVKIEARKIQKANSNKKKILLIHSDLPGAIDTNGREVGTSNLTRKLSALFKTWDLVLCGHIHKPQLLRKKNPTILIMGATHQQRVSDSGTDMGYWKIYDDLTFKFVKLAIPRYIYLPAGTEPPDTNNFYIQEPQKVTQSEPSELVENFATQNPTKLAINYLKVHKIKSKRKKKLLIKYLTHDAGK